MKEDSCRKAMRKAPIGYACNRMLRDENGEPYDFEYEEVNEFFADLLGMKTQELIGCRDSETRAKLHQIMPEWIGLFGRSQDEATAEEFEHIYNFGNQEYRIRSFAAGEDHFVIFVTKLQQGAGELQESGNLAGIFKKVGFEFENNKEEKLHWEERLNEIADVLKLENDLQFQRIIENLPFSLDIVTMDGKILYANAKCMELFEFEEAEMKSRNTSETWEDPAMRGQWIEMLNQKSVVNDFEMHLKSFKGKKFWAIGSGILIQYQDQTCILSTQLNITERKEMESAIQASEEKYRLLTEFTSDIIWVMNLEQNRYTYISPSVVAITGYTPEEVLAGTIVDILTPESAILVKDSVEKHAREFRADPDLQRSYILEIRQKCKNGDVIWVEASSKYRFNSAGEIEIVGVSRNIEERKKAEREVLYLSYHDQLTGIYNRRFYEEELRRMNFQRNLPVTMVLADVNGLKLTNDAFGHLAGDELLKKFTAALNEELRAEDVAARIGGDEFVLLLPKTDGAGAECLIDRIRERIRNTKCEHAILSASFGWATKRTIEEDFEALFIQAEDKMYHTKLSESTAMKNETIRLAMQKLFEKNIKEQYHSERVGKLCREIGAAMGLSENELWDLEMLGRIHDIGKIGIQGEILGKLQKLTETEWLEVRRHPEVGYQILRSADEYVHIAESVLSHHERPDGTGYPRKLKLNEIPLQARILTIAEAYDIIQNGQLFKDHRKIKDPIKELTANSGTQFDGEIVDLFINKVLKSPDRSS